MRLSHVDPHHEAALVLDSFCSAGVVTRFFSVRLARRGCRSMNRGLGTLPPLRHFTRRCRRFCRLNTLAAKVGAAGCEFPAGRKFAEIYFHDSRRGGIPSVSCPRERESGFLQCGQDARGPASSDENLSAQEHLKYTRHLAFQPGKDRSPYAFQQETFPISCLSWRRCVNRRNRRAE